MAAVNPKILVATKGDQTRGVSGFGRGGAETAVLKVCGSSPLHRRSRIRYNPALLSCLLISEQ